ncbi:pre-mycofactocin synthase MftD [Pseudonocardia xinjiangensis]|uniref:pre-mycofactocin synthase MftD n=1 Tax=Pseudonocardia xinjiangensis TaxID=75289 RepID=UPI003D9396F7
MASRKIRFESVAEAQRLARRRLPQSVYQALVAGSERGITIEDNVNAFSELGFRPRIADLPRSRQQATRILGQDVAFPVLVSPTAVQAVSPEGEVAVARAAFGADTMIGLSSFASKPIEEVVAANPKTFFQLYWVGGRDRIAKRVERARKAGAVALAVTLDWTFASRRDWGTPPVPERLDVRTLAKYLPEGIRRPRWVLDYARHGGLPDLVVPNLGVPGEPDPTFYNAYGEWLTTPLPSWDDIAWLREEWGGEFLVKGIMHPDDAMRAVDIGATAISVSNHGGNNLDGTPASIRVLPAVVDAVGDRIEVLQDGGIRRGSDVVKALALGARAVLIGRAYLWGLAAGGEGGVANVLSILHSGIDETLLGLGRSSVNELTRDDLLIPEGFSRGLAHRPC